MGEEGAELARVWLVVVVVGGGSWVEWMLGEEEEDLREDFRGLPFERRMGEEEERVGVGCALRGGDRGEERGKGMGLWKWVVRESFGWGR